LKIAFAGALFVVPFCAVAPKEAKKKTKTKNLLML
jgi:hypothetical protein